MRSATMLLAVTAAGGGRASDFYVSRDGRPGGDGSRGSPWDLATAFASPGAVRPGDRIWLQGGTYSLERGLISQLQGEAKRPIVVRAAPGARVTLDCAAASAAQPGVSCLEIRGGHAWYWGFEILNSRTERWTEEPGAAADPRGTGVHSRAGEGVKLINLTIHDVGQAIFESQPSGIEIYGLIAYHCGWEGPERSHGPGIYIRNRAEWPEKTIEDSIVFENYRQGLQGYGSAANVFSRFRVSGSIWFNNGIGREGFHRNLMFGNETNGHVDNVFRENYTYFTPGGGGLNSFGAQGGCDELRLESNVFAHGPTGTAAEIGPCRGLELERNLFYGEATVDGRPLARSHLASLFFEQEPPQGMYAFLRQNRYERGRAHLVVYNWRGEDRVRVDVSSLKVPVGAEIDVRSVGDLFGEGRRIEAADGLMVVPMTGWGREQPVGVIQELPATLPEFGVFVLRWSEGAGPQRARH